MIGPKLFDPKLTWLQASSRLSKFIHPRIAERFLGALSYNTMLLEKRPPKPLKWHPLLKESKATHRFDVIPDSKETFQLPGMG